MGLHSQNQIFSEWVSWDSGPGGCLQNDDGSEEDEHEVVPILYCCYKLPPGLVA